MKKIHIIIFILIPFILGSCKDDDFVEIDTLQIFGDEFYMGQVVNMGLAVKTSNPDDNYYLWWCEAGGFPETQQGYPVIKWTAPKQNGEFLIRCTVTCGEASETREAKVKVSGLFFDRFSGTALTNWTTTNQTTLLSNGRLITNIPSNRPNDSIGFVQKTLNVSNFFYPFSFTTEVGIVGESSTFNPKYPVTTTNPTWDNFMSVGVTGSTPSTTLAPTYYISEIMVDWWPTDHFLSQITYFDPSDDQTPRTINASDFDARLSVLWTRRPDPVAGIPQQTGRFMLFFKSDAFKFGPDVTGNVGMSMNENAVRIYVDKTEVFSTSAVHTWSTQHNAPLQISTFKYAYPSQTMVYMDNLVVNNSAELLY